ncbi:Protein DETOXIFICATION [Heracleum sosnowskyi]|uniref:Protein DETOXIFICATION n=1 Tax=Heracleum sosnowskyi TaxID=360622 RepID=A0AAD8MS05_9APIA|nr:Protein DETOXIFICATION [Heracleum sosnowskyi]
MAASQLYGGGTSTRMLTRELIPNTAMGRSLSLQRSSQFRNSYALVNGKRLRFIDIVARASLSTKYTQMSSPLPVMRQRRSPLLEMNYKLSSDSSVQTSDMDEGLSTEEEFVPSTSEDTFIDLNEISTSVASDKVKAELKENATNPTHELIALSLPAILGQAIDPFAQLMETAFIGRLGPVELASAGVSMSIFNIVSKLFNIPLLSVATSFVAEDISKNSSSISTSVEDHKEMNNGRPLDTMAKREQLSSVSTALTLAIGIGLFEAVALWLGSGVFLNLMGLSSATSMHAPARHFLSLRAIGAPAVVVSLALQGIFRGFKDTKTPVICLGIGSAATILLLPVLMYYFKLGVTGAAISTVVSQYIVTCLMLWHLNKRAVLLPPKLGSLQFGGYLKSGGFLLGRTVAVLITTTIGTSMATRQGPLAMAAHQICLQVWLAVSLLTDALAASGQALISGSASKGDYRSVKEVTYSVLKIGFGTGVLLTLILGASFSSLATLFTKDAEVLAIVRTGVLFVSASQPLNALAFIFDGLHYGVSDFKYAACSMMVVGAISSMFLYCAPSVFGLPGVWAGLTLFMGLRTLAGVIRLSSKDGPWWFLHKDSTRLEFSAVH